MGITPITPFVSHTSSLQALLYCVSRLSPDGFLKGIQDVLLKKILIFFYALPLKLDLVQTALVVLNQFYSILCYEFEDLQILFKWWLIHPHKRWASLWFCLQGSHCLCPTTEGCSQPEPCLLPASCDPDPSSLARGPCLVPRGCCSAQLEKEVWAQSLQKTNCESLQLMQDDQDVLGICFTKSPWKSRNGGVLLSYSVRAIPHTHLQQIQYGARHGITNCRIRNSRKTTTVFFIGHVHNTKPFPTELYYHV